MLQRSLSSLDCDEVALEGLLSSDVSSLSTCKRVSKRQTCDQLYTLSSLQLITCPTLHMLMDEMLGNPLHGCQPKESFDRMAG
jgi:hypothetical protein